MSPNWNPSILTLSALHSLKQTKDCVLLDYLTPCLGLAAEAHSIDSGLLEMLDIEQRLCVTEKYV